MNEIKYYIIILLLIMLPRDVKSYEKSTTLVNETGRLKGQSESYSPIDKSVANNLSNRKLKLHFNILDVLGSSLKRITMENMKKKEEVYKDIPNYEGLYKISKDGQVRSFYKKADGQELIATTCNSTGYPKVGLSKNGKRKMFSVHQLMAITYLGHQPNGYGLVVDHIDNIKTNNSLCNLQLVSNRQNSSKDKVNPCIQETKGGRFRVQCTVDNKGVSVGTFDSLDEAILRRDIFLGNLNKNSNNDLLMIALGEYGTAEYSGDKNNPEVVKYGKDCGGDGTDSQPWCSSFMNWVAKTGNYEHTNKLNARSWLDIGTDIHVNNVRIGDVCILWRGSKSSWQGHTAMYVKHDSTNVWLLGGNQSNKVTISKYPLNQVLGFRRLSKLDTIVVEEDVIG